MIVRMHSLGVVLGLWFLATLGFSPLTLAEGAVSRASGYSAPVKRPLFRPWGGLESTSFSVRPRSQVNPVSRQAANAWTPARQEVFSDRRVGGRKAVPVTRGQDLGLRFRPDERDPAYGESGGVPADSRPGDSQQELQSQFRPVQRKRKPTYEELQAGDFSFPPPVAPAMPYPVLPPPPTGYGGGPYPPAW